MDRHLSLKRKLRMETLMDIIFVSPKFILYLGLTILPFFIAIPIMFTDRLSFIDNEVTFIGFENFRNIFNTYIFAEFFPAVIRTAVFTLINYSMIYLFGMTLALLMFELTTSIRKAFFTIIYMPYMTSGLGIGMMLVLLFAKDTGSLNLLLLKLGLIKEAIDITEPSIATWALPLMVGWKTAGFYMALFLSGLLVQLLIYRFHWWIFSRQSVML